jgi:hypothetical protein
MPLLECPHCHRTVFVGDTRSPCPACNRQVKDTDGASAHMTLLKIYDDLPLPAVCIECVAPTERTELISSDYRPTLRDAARASIMAASILVRQPIDDRIQARVHKHVYRCERCAERGPIHVDGIDDERGAIIVLVNRKFAELMGKPQA